MGRVREQDMCNAAAVAVGGVVGHQSPYPLINCRSPTLLLCDYEHIKMSGCMDPACCLRTEFMAGLGSAGDVSQILSRCLLTSHCTQPPCVFVLQFREPIIQEFNPGKVLSETNFKLGVPDYAKQPAEIRRSATPSWDYK
jgi:hypothetical protein